MDRTLHRQSSKYQKDRTPHWGTRQRKDYPRAADIYDRRGGKLPGIFSRPYHTF